MVRELLVEHVRWFRCGEEVGRVCGGRRVIHLRFWNDADGYWRMGLPRQQVSDVIGVGAKTIYKYFPANSYEALRCISDIHQ